MEYVYSNKPSQIASDEISLGVNERLESGEKILLLVSGGSGTDLVVNISKKLTSHKLSNLSLTLVDERYGKLGHENENWRQLIAAGFNPDKIDAYRPLIGEEITATVDRYGAWLENRLKQANYKIGLFGIGADGHTAGLKPSSTAISDRGLASYYVSEDYERITITPATIRQLDEVVVYAVGDYKRKVLSDFLNDNAPITVMPAQILKEIPKLTIYTNNKKEELN